MPNHISFGVTTAKPGAYILWIAVAKDIMVTFAVSGTAARSPCPPVFAYMGSAMGRHGSSSLAGRLLRHARAGTSHQPPCLACPDAGGVGRGRAGRARFTACRPPSGCTGILITCFG